MNVTYPAYDVFCLEGKQKTSCTRKARQPDRSNNIFGNFQSTWNKKKTI